MKILFIGQLNEGQTTLMRMQELQALGHDVIPINSSAIWTQSGSAVRRIQQTLGTGPLIDKLNTAVMETVTRQRPALVWAEKQEYLRPSTIAAIQSKGIRLLHYTPDPYWSLSWKRTTLMDAALPMFDFVVTSKQYELDEYRRRCRTVIYSPLGYSEHVHRPILPVDSRVRATFSTDVNFVGGWEPRRERMLTRVHALGYGLKIWGFAWDHLVDGCWTPRRALRLRRLAGNDTFRITRSPLATSIQGGEIYGDSYAWALTGARISIGFLRVVCPDQHTTRSFEIPACGSMLLADRTAEHQEFFTEGKEAEFFESEQELVEKAQFYLRNEEARARIARRGLQRCFDSGYSYRHRVKDIMDGVGT